MKPLEDAGEHLDRAWGVVSHLHGVMDVPEWREAYNQMLPEVTRFYAELGQNLALFGQYRKIRESAEFDGLNPARQRIIENAIRDFRLSGAELAETDKPRFQQIQEQLSGLAAKFSENLLDSTNAHAEWIEDEADLDGIPGSARAAARAAAEREGKSGWKFSLQMPSYLPVLQYAENRALRERMYRAYATRASELGKADWDNGPLMTEILKLRAEEARMLGYQTSPRCRWYPRWRIRHNRYSNFLSIWRRAQSPSPNATSPNSRPLQSASSASTTCSPGTSPGHRKSSSMPATASRTKRSASTFRNPRSSPACSRS